MDSRSASAPAVPVTSTALWVAMMSAAFFFRQVLAASARYARTAGVAQVAPGFIDHHQFHPGGFVRVLKREPEAFQEIEQCGLAQILMLGRASEVDHVPVGQVEIVPVGRVVESTFPTRQLPYHRPIAGHIAAGKEWTKTVIVRRAGGKA